VTLGLAPGRPSRVPVVLHVRARRRCPTHPLQCARCTSPIMRRVRIAKVSRHAHDGAAARRGRGECEVPPLEIGVRAMRLSPYRAGLAGRHGTRLPVPPAFPTGSCPLQLSPSGKSMTQESPFELLLTVSRMQHRVPRRTLSHHPALQFPELSRYRPSASRIPVPPPAREACFPSPWGCQPPVDGFPVRRLLRKLRDPRALTP
jgi:hypothetical protein